MKRLFRRLSDILDAWAGKDYEPWKLEPHEIDALRTLRHTDEWAVFLKVLDTQSILYGEDLIATMDANRMWMLKGHILGIRKAGILVDEILKSEQEKAKKDERRRSNAGHEHDHELTALINTPGW